MFPIHLLNVFGDVGVFFEKNHRIIGKIPKAYDICRLFRKQKENISIMARVCQISGKRPLSGNNVSHANNRTRRKFYPNLHTKRFYIPEEDKWVTLKVSASIIRTINKNGISSVLRKARKQGNTLV